MPLNGNQTVYNIGYRGGIYGGFWNGYIKNVLIEDMSDGSNSAFFRIDDGWDNNPTISNSFNRDEDAISLNASETDWYEEDA